LESSLTLLVHLGARGATIESHEEQLLRVHQVDNVLQVVEDRYPDLLQVT
jgi:hypothetical protein